jgi:hypothetical protein
MVMGTRPYMLKMVKVAQSECSEKVVVMEKASME